MSRASSTPPILPSELAPPPRRVVWPIVLGVIAIVFGALGGFQSLTGMMLPLIMPLMDNVASQMPAGQGQMVNPFAMMREYIGWFMGGYVLLGISAAMLVTTGIGLLRRRPWAITLVRVWGVLTILLAIGFGVGVAIFQSAMFDAVIKAAEAQAAARGPRSVPPPPQVGMVVGTITGVIVAVMLSILPMFMLIWFALPGVRAEVASWRRDQQRATSA